MIFLWSRLLEAPRCTGKLRAGMTIREAARATSLPGVDDGFHSMPSGGRALSGTEPAQMLGFHCTGMTRYPVPSFSTCPSPGNG